MFSFCSQILMAIITYLVFMIQIKLDEATTSAMAS